MGFVTFVGILLSFIVYTTAQDNTCPELTSCFGEITKDGTAQSKQTNRLRDLEQVGDCGAEEANKAADMLDEIREKRKQRLALVERCINGDPSSFPGCPALRESAFSSLDTAPRECAQTRQEFIHRLTGGAAGGNPRRNSRRNNNNNNNNNINSRQPSFRNSRQQQKHECKQLSCGCPEAKLCHQCYEISPLHDDIHTLNMEIDLLRIKCNIPQKPKGGGKFRSPDQDEDMDEAMTT